MTNQQIIDLVNKYFNAEGYTFPGDFEHRFDPESSAILYSVLREFKPKNCLSIGTWEGGSVCVIMAALLKNENEFSFTASEILDDKRANTQQHCLAKNGVAPIMIGDITQNLDKVPDELDFLFVDTNHDLETTVWIFKNVVLRLKKGALLAMHDWAVEEKEGELIGKGDHGKGGWPETDYIMDLLRENKLPVEKIHWTWNNPTLPGMERGRETAIWRYVG